MARTSLCERMTSVQWWSSFAQGPAESRGVSGCSRRFGRLLRARGTNAPAIRSLAPGAWHPGEVDSFQFLEGGLELVRRELAHDPARHADLLHTLATVFYRADRRDRAQPLVEEAVALRQSLYGTSHRDTAESRLLLGTLHERRGEYAEAEEQYRLAAEGAVAALGANDPFAIQCRSALAGLRFTRREPGAEEELEALLIEASHAR